MGPTDLETATPPTLLFNPRFTVLDETTDWIVADKPAHLLSHPTNPGNPPTLWDGLRGLLAFEIANGAVLSIITRLDRDTSGIVLVAKHHRAARTFSLGMQRGEFAKEYLALVRGWPERDAWTEDGPILRRGDVAPSPIWVKQMVHPDGRPCRTRFTVAERRVAPGAPDLPFALVRCFPETGRMHQIRVHLAHAGHPVLGDKIYGPDETCYLDFIASGWTEALRRRLILDRHALHAHRLAFQDLEWRSPLAADLAAFLERGNPAPSGGPDRSGER
jgi:23S rRNA pseudouridine1911/1915/1917 synthase